MKTSLAAPVGIAILLAAGMPLAQDTNAPASNHNDHAAKSVSSANATSQMGQMDEHMKKMQALHDKMMSAATADERQKVMDEQRKEMQASMGMMKDMQSGAMMGGMGGGAMMGGMGGGAMGQKGKATDAGAQMLMMQKRVDMMQMMMQMMMDQQGMMAPTKPGDIAPKK